MNTLQKIAVWTAMLIGTFIFSDFLINVGLNSTYKDIERKDNNSQIVVYQADATYVNGRIRGVIKEVDKIKDKYLKIELYSKRDVLVGRRYIEIGNDSDIETKSFELLFKANDVSYYKMGTANEKEPGDEVEIISKELTKPEIILTTAMMFLIFW